MSLLLFSTVAAAQVTVNTVASRVVGHPQLTLATSSPNLVEGREFNSPQGIVVDTAANPPTLFVADTANNRVLGWRNATSFANGSRADLVLGQPDFFTTTGSTATGRLYFPTGLAVDSQHSLYVVDSRNNRVLRFPDPFARQQSGGDQVPDLVLGQKSFSTGTANSGGVSASTLRTCCASGNVPYRASVAIDQNGNVWVSDPGNHRVLRYPAANLGAGARGPDADIVLGQPDFTTASAPPSGASTRANKGLLRVPSGVVFDRSGNRLYVSDELSRVLVFDNPRLGVPQQQAARLLGISVVSSGQQPAPDVVLYAPEGVLMIGDRPAVVDTGGHRIVIYPPYEQWEAESSTNPSPRATAIVGQFAFAPEPKSNRNQQEPANNSLSAPVAAWYAGSELFVADAGNNRVLVFPQVAGAFSAATRLLGQDDFMFNAPNLIEGRELFLGNAGGIAVDTRSDPPHLYVADTYNNRVLGFRDVRKVTAGSRADLVIGQPDFRRSIANYKTLDPSNSRDTPTPSSLYLPVGLTLDSAGNLWVADAGNGRVLRFSRPFEQGNFPNADLVIGQGGFGERILDLPSRSRMSAPYGLAFDAEFGLFVSDQGNNRVLFFPAPYTNGMDAAKVFGQADFITGAAGNTMNRMNGPTHLAVDSSGRLHVADTGNNRILLFETGRLAQETDQFAQNSIAGLNRPFGVFVSHVTGEIWVAETGRNRAIRFPKFTDLPIGSAAPTALVPSAGPLAVAQDTFGTLYIADAANRVALYYPPVAALNGASFLSPFATKEAADNSIRTAIQNGTVTQLLAAYPPLAPAMWASLFPLDIALGGIRLIESTAVATSYPIPTELGDIQVLIGDRPAPILFVAPGQINFQIPSGTQASGLVEVRVERKSTGQIVAIGNIAMRSESPALFMREDNPGGFKQIAAINQDGSINSSVNQVARGQVIQLFGTGQGLVSGQPADGQPVPTGQLYSTSEKPRVITSAGELDQSNVQFSGLAPDLVGVWQVNVRIPTEVSPGHLQLVLQFKGVNTNGAGQVPDAARVRTSIWVK